MLRGVWGNTGEVKPKLRGICGMGERYSLCKINPRTTHTLPTLSLSYTQHPSDARPLLLKTGWKKKGKKTEGGKNFPFQKPDHVRLFYWFSSDGTYGIYFPSYDGSFEAALCCRTHNLTTWLQSMNCVEEKVGFPRNTILRGSSLAPHRSFHRPRTPTELSLLRSGCRRTVRDPEV